MIVVIPQVPDFLQRIPEALEGSDALDFLKLPHGIIAVARVPVHNLRFQQANLLVMPEGSYGHSAKAGKLPDFQLVFTHNNCALLLSGCKDNICRRVRVKRKMKKVYFNGFFFGLGRAGIVALINPTK